MKARRPQAATLLLQRRETKGTYGMAGNDKPILRLSLAITLGFILSSGCEKHESQPASSTQEGSRPLPSAQDESQPPPSRQDDGQPPARPTISIHEAASTGNVLELKAHLYWGCDLNEMGTSRMTPLALAALQGHTNVVELLLAAGPASMSRASSTLPPCNSQRPPVIWTSSDSSAPRAPRSMP